MDVYLKLFLVLGLVQVIYIIGLLASCWVQKLPIRRIDIFQWGPCLYQGNIGETEIRIATIPFGTAVSIIGMTPEEVDVPGGFATKGKIGRASIHLVSVFSIILVGFWVCGGTTAFHLLLTGTQQIVAGTWAPLSIGKIQALRFFDLVDKGPLMLAVGVFCLKYAALCLLPIPLQNLFNAILELCSNGRNRMEVAGRFVFIGFFLNLWIFASWFAAIVAAGVERARGDKPESWIVAAVSVLALLVALSNRDRAIHPKPVPEPEKTIEERDEKLIERIAKVT
jgi:hypothetical protein